MAWRFTFPKEVGAGETASTRQPSGTVICRIDDEIEARYLVERLFGAHSNEYAIIVTHLSDDAASELGVELGECHIV